MNRFRANPKLLAPLLAGLAMLGPFSIDSFFPAFKLIEADFSITPATMQQTISTYLAAFAVMSLLHGPLSDAYGRRSVIVYSLVLYIAATIGCALSPNIETLLLFRALQGVSAGAGVIVGRAIIRDRFEGADAQRLMSQVSLIFALAPAIAPIVGGWILGFSQWRTIFFTLAAFTVVLLVVSIGALPETLPKENRSRFAPKPLVKTLRAVFGDLRFVFLAFACAFNFGGLFLYISSAPTIVLTLLGLNEHQFAWLFIPVIGGMTIGSQLSGRVAGRLSAPRTVALGFTLIFAGLVLNLLVSLLVAPSVPWSVLPVGLSGVGVSLTFPDADPVDAGSLSGGPWRCGLGSGLGHAGIQRDRIRRDITARLTWLCAAGIDGIGTQSERFRAVAAVSSNDTRRDAGNDAGSRSDRGYFQRAAASTGLSGCLVDRRIVADGNGLHQRV